MTTLADESACWYCGHCAEDLRRGVDALACDDADECPYSADWDGDACGYIVCRQCHRPAVERPTFGECDPIK